LSGTREVTSRQKATRMHRGRPGKRTHRRRQPWPSRYCLQGQMSARLETVLPYAIH
jgi:hypothetical protein